MVCSRVLIGPKVFHYDFLPDYSPAGRFEHGFCGYIREWQISIASMDMMTNGRHKLTQISINKGYHYVKK